MRKLFNIIMALTLVFTYACTGDHVGEIYNPKNNLAEFSVKKQSVKIKDASENVYLVEVSRDNISGRVEIPVTVASEANIFTVPSTVVFEDSVRTTTIRVEMNTTEMTPGAIYQLKLNLPKQVIKEKVVSTVLSVSKDYTWKPFATGTMTANLFESETETQLLQAEEDASRFKLVAPYDASADLEFIQNSDNTIALPEGPNKLGTYDFATGVTDEEYGPIQSYIFPDSELDTENKILNLNILFYVSAGSFGQFVDTFTW